MKGQGIKEAARKARHLAVCIGRGIVCLALCYAVEADEAGTRRGAREVYAHIASASEAVRSYVSRMTDEKKAALLFLVNINGKDNFCPVEYAIPGGYLFFYYNIADTAQGVKAFTASIRAWCKKHGMEVPYLAVDQEGGDVCRLREVAPPLPSQKSVASSMTEDEASAIYEAQSYAMRAMGFNLNLAPVAEVLNDRNREVLCERSFGGAQDVVRYGRVCVASYKRGGIACALKHFPCNAASDPHTGRSEVAIGEDVLAGEMSPFLCLIHCGAEAIVMSHARVNGLPPACMSSYWVGVLRDEGFRGLVISDDIFMAAVADGYTPQEASIKAIEAGADVIMVTEKRFAKPLMAVVTRMKEDSSFAARVEESCFRVVLFKLHRGILKMDDILQNDVGQ